MTYKWFTDRIQAGGADAGRKTDTGILLMYIVPDAWVPDVGYVYCGFFFAMRLPGFLDRRNST